jgi:uncharacterized Zn-binding protein involved in type VI secretion
MLPLVVAATLASASPPWGGPAPIALGRTISASAPLPASAFGRAVAVLADGVAVGCVEAGAPGPASVGWVETWARDDDLRVAGWRPAQLLGPFGVSPADAPPDGAFGAALAADASWLFVGQPFAAVDGLPAAGLVHAFRRSSDGTWTFVTALAAATPSADAEFGRALAFDGATLAVGGASSAHAAAVGAASLAVAVEIPAPALDGLEPVGWGRAVAVSGSRLLVAAPSASVEGERGAGAVVAFSLAAPGRPTLEGLVAPPNGPRAGDSFGAALAASGDRLAVAAPGSDKGGADAGTVFLYDRDAQAWAFQTEILGTQPGEGLGAVAFDDDVVAIGSETFDDPETPAVDGGAWLYRVSGRIPELLVQARPTDPGVTDARVGGAVALASGRWAHSLVRGPTSFAIGGVRIADVGDVGDDCNEDGVADGANVTAFGEPDCDDNLVPDSCDLATDDCDGNAEIDACETALVRGAVIGGTPGAAGWGLVGAPDIAVLFLVALEVPQGTDGVLRGIDADWYAPISAQPAFVAIYDDPDQDGHPVDATLRAVEGISPAAGYGVDRVRMAPRAIGPAGTSYFVGLGVKATGQAATSSFLRGAAADGGPPTTFTVVGNAETLAFGMPGRSPLLAPLAGGTANVWCAGLFGAPTDANVNGDARRVRVHRRPRRRRRRGPAGPRRAPRRLGCDRRGPRRGRRRRSERSRDRPRRVGTVLSTLVA